MAKKKPNYFKWINAQSYVKSVKKRVIALEKKLEAEKKKSAAARTKAGKAYKRKYK